MTPQHSWDAIKKSALSARSRLFAAVLGLNYDKSIYNKYLQYIGHLVTKTAVNAGYIEHRQDLKGNTIVEWARSDVIDGRGAPNQWACLSAVDLLVQNQAAPEPSDDVLIDAYAYYWFLGHGPFNSWADLEASLPPLLNTPWFRARFECAFSASTSN